MSTSASQFAIVVPVYNVIQYLPEFLDSLDKQTSKAFFVIAVDDGSTDRAAWFLIGSRPLTPGSPLCISLTPASPLPETGDSIS